MTDDPAAQVAAITKRHENSARLLGYVDTPLALMRGIAEEAHADLATLLALVADLQARLTNSYECYQQMARERRDGELRAEQAEAEVANLRTALAEIAAAFKPWTFWKKGNTIVLAHAIGGDEPTRRESLELYRRLEAWFTTHAAALGRKPNG